MGSMQRLLFVCVAALFAVLPSLAATNIIEKVTPDKPLRYEKRNGRLEVRSLITLSKARKIGDETLDAGLETLASDVSGKACDVVLFNTFAQPRTAIATVSSQDASVQVLDAAGTAVSCQRRGDPAPCRDGGNRQDRDREASVQGLPRRQVQHHRGGAGRPRGGPRRHAHPASRPPRDRDGENLPVIRACGTDHLQVAHLFFRTGSGGIVKSAKFPCLR